MSLPNNLVRFGVLLFAFGAVTGLLLAASLGTRLGTVFGLLLVLAALGMLLQSSVEEDDEDEEEEEDENSERFGDASLRSIAQILHSLITGSAFFWAIMTFVTHFFGYEFDRNTWLLPPIYGLLIGGWSVMLDQAQSIKQVLEQRAKGKQDE